MEIAQEVVTVATTGGAGVSAGSAYSKSMNGWLENIFIDWNATAPATSDITIALDRGGNVIAISDSATDAFVAPRIKPVDSANAAITNAHDKFALNGRLLVSVAQSNDLTPAVTVYIRYLRIS